MEGITDNKKIIPISDVIDVSIFGSVPIIYGFISKIGLYEFSIQIEEVNVAVADSESDNDFELYQDYTFEDELDEYDAEIVNEEVEFDEEEDILLDDLDSNESIAVIPNEPLKKKIILNLNASTDIEITEGFSLVINQDGFEVSMSFKGDDFDRLSTETNFGLKFSKEYLHPMKREGEKFVKVENAEDVVLNFANLIISVDSEGDIGVDGGLGASIEGPVMIGDTGIILEDINMELNITGDRDSDSRPAGLPDDLDWKGLFIKSAYMRIPDLFSGRIGVCGLGIGSGGVSGTISYYDDETSNEETSDDSDPKSIPADKTLETDVFGMSGSLKSIDLTLQQNIPTGGKIGFEVTLPFFDDGPLSIEVGIAADGGFTVEVEGEMTLEKADLLSIDVESIGFEYEDETWAATLAGKITPEFLGMNWPGFDVKALTIDSEGDVKLEGGWIDLPKQKTLDFNGFKIELSKIAFGTEEKPGEKWRWMGFSGGINIVDGLPMKGGVEGLKIKWKEGSDSDSERDETERDEANLVEVEMKGVYLGFEVEDTVKFEGKAFLIEGDNEWGFKGGVKMEIIPIKMSLDAQFIAGKNEDPPFKFFYLKLDLGLPAGIPLGSTGLSLYGMGGLFGYNMEPKKDNAQEGDSDNNGWLELYNRAPEKDMTPIEKWEKTPESMAFGLGLTLGTGSDDGYTFNGKVLFAVITPGPILIVQGEAGILQKRSEDPQFKLLAVYDNRSGTFLMNLDGTYEKKNKLEITGSAEAFFDLNDPQAWHFYLGQDEPQSKRIRAEIVEILSANAYFMTDTQGIRTGIRVGFDKRWKFGDSLEVVLKAMIDGELNLSTEPLHAWGSLDIEGDIKLSAFGFSTGLSTRTSLRAEAPKPMYIKGDFNVRMDLPWPLPDPEASFALEWREETEPPFPEPLAKIGIEHLKVSEKWELDVFREDEAPPDTPPPPIVPLDSCPVITFTHPVEDTSGRIGDNHAGAISPEKVGDYEYKYSLTEIILKKKPIDGTGDWEDENVPLYGKWQITPGGQKNLKLLLWANTEFDISREMTSNKLFLSDILSTRLGFPFDLDTTPSWMSVDFDDLVTGSRHLEVMLHGGLYFYSEESFITVVDHRWKGGRKAVQVEGQKHYSEVIAALVASVVPRSVPYQNSQNSTSTQENPNSNSSFGGDLLIKFPEQMANIEVVLAGGAEGEIRLFDESGRIIQTVDIPGGTGVQSLLLGADDKNIAAIQVSGIFRVLKISYLSREEALRIEQNETALEHAATAIEERQGKHVAPFLEPLHDYMLKIKTKVTRGKGGSSEDEYFTNFAFFKTEDAPGIYEELTNESASNDLEHYPYDGPLKDITPYVTRTTPPLAASNEPQILHYRSYDVSVDFNESKTYMHRLYNENLHLRILDSNNLPVTDTDGSPLELEQIWSDNDGESVLTREERQIKKILDPTDEGIYEELTGKLSAQSRRLSMKPRTLHRAELCGKDSKVLYDFSFLTSRYCSFIHHLHSFEDAVWDNWKLLGSPTGVSYEDRLEEILTNLDCDPERFQCLMELFFEGNPKSLPDRIEITNINDAERSYGLFFESPEPIDWSRVNLEIFFQDTDNDMKESTSSIKVIGGSIDSVNNTFKYIDILLQEQMDISNLSIMAKSLVDNPSEEYEKFYTFNADEGTFPAGTVFRICLCDGSSEQTNPIEFEFRYTSENAETILDPNGVSIRIQDNEENTLHERTIIQYTEKLNFEKISNKDQTRTFILIKNSNNEIIAPNGRYRFDFTFERKLIEGLWLRRLGELYSEEASLEFSLPALRPDF